MSQVTHRQYDESPSRFFTLTFPTTDPASWPALNAEDKVTLLMRQKTGQGAGGADIAVPLTIVDPATREVRWDPSGPAIAVAGEHDFVIRVTEQNNRSYTHPEEGVWKLKIDRTAPDTDLPDPA